MDRAGGRAPPGERPAGREHARVLRTVGPVRRRGPSRRRCRPLDLRRRRTRVAGAAGGVGPMTDFHALHDEENADFSSFLHTLAPEDWDRPSLCEGWRVRDVVGHILYGNGLKLWTLPWKLGRF